MKKRYIFILFLLTAMVTSSAIAASDKAEKEGAMELESVVVKDISSREIMTEHKEAKNTFIVTQEQIQENNYKNVEEVLQDAPGIIVNNTAFGPKIDMRGNGDKSLSKVKVMVDGISINPTEEAMASLPINSIPIESIKKIDIIPGGGATLYGSGSVGGVVNIVTNSNATKDNFFMDMKYASYDSRSFGFSGGNNLTEKLYANYGFNYINSEGYRRGDNTQDTLYLGGFDYKINDNNKIRLQARHGEQKFDSTSDISKADLARNRRAQGLNLDTEATNDSYTLDFQHRFSDVLAFGITGYKQIQERDVTADSIDDIIIIASSRTMTWAEDHMKFLGIKSTLDGKFKETKDGIKIKGNYSGDMVDLIFGYDYLDANNKRKSHIESEILKTYSTGYSQMTLNPGEMKPVINNVNIDLSKEVHSLYEFTKIKVTDALDVTFGGRGEWTTYSGSRNNGPNTGPMIDEPKYQNITTDESLTNYAGEAGLLYKYRISGSAYIRYERGFVTPFASQLTDKIHDDKMPNPNGFFTPPEINTASIYVANGLDAETTDTLEIGFRDFLLGSFVALSLYATDTKDEITAIHSGVTNPAVKRWKYRNIGKTRRMGFELEADQEFSKFAFNQSLSYVSAEVTKGDPRYKIKKGDKIPMVPKMKVTFGAKYSFTNYLSALAKYTYVSKKETRELDDKDEVYRHTIDSHGTVDLGLLYKVDDYATLKFGVKNLMNEKYNLRETRDYAVPAAERNYYLELNVKF
ncbi:MAG: hemin receptor [Deltaproteobacteria bacterium]|nr:MAG: hemin receptor [Deltaproteobacteria bacterium]PIE74928.1 MAG: hemin receptor [Deltaproteobacteria bacterium]